MEEEKIINHFCHNHPLILTQTPSTEQPPSCYGCHKPVTSEAAYICTQQKYCHNKTIIHQTCAESPKHISHPSHPQHPLHLFDYTDYTFKCNQCQNIFEQVIGYRCHVCDFDIDISCKPPNLLQQKTLLHPSHRHQLMLMRKPPALFYCDGCGREDRDGAYVCSLCEFWLHEKCALLPIPVMTEHHHHPLNLEFWFPFEFRKFQFECGVCEEGFNVTDWVCFCGVCRFFAHVKCAISVRDTQVINSNQQKGDGSVLIQLPVDDISKELILPFIIRARENNAIANISNTEVINASTITPEKITSSFNHHKHPLNLVDEAQQNDKSMSMICDVCVTRIHSPPYYNCTTCKNYFLHSTCYSVPKTIRLDSLYGECTPPSRSHNLTSYTKSSEYDTNGACSICQFDTNGTLYKCKDCDVSIDLKCASLPIAITHASHPHHELTLKRVSVAKSGVECKACEYEIKSSFIVAYFCNGEGCEFALDVRCALLPKNVKHEWDKMHNLELMYDASSDHPSDFYCEICEVEMHPKKWMYHCRECDLSFHFGCLTASGRYRNVKFGREFEFDVGLHPHPLEYNRVSLKLRCDVCHEEVYKYPGFECALCNYVVCEKCGLEELRKL